MIIQISNPQRSQQLTGLITHKAKIEKRGRANDDLRVASQVASRTKQSTQPDQARCLHPKVLRCEIAELNALLYPSRPFQKETATNEHVAHWSSIQ
eukprot:scaffold229059_cov14-Tisochrysis_lutea.AAC.1